jgi:hypothetical protein
LVACGDDSTGPPPDDGGNNPEPQATAPGTPTGTATNAIIGAAGGTLASDDGSFAIDVPAGALASDTDITIQPITNTAWGGIASGYRLTPDGLTFSQPIELVFDVAPEDLAGSHPDFLDVVYQDAEGLWYVLNNGTYDDVAGTLTAQTTHFTDYSNIEGIQIRPGSASVGTLGTIDLNVRYCHQEVVDDLVSLVYACDEELTPLATLSNWSVNGIAGGNSTVGRVISTNGHTGHFTAPASVPQNNPVAVSVQARGRRSTQTLVCNITIGSSWYGTATADWGNGERIVANVVWKSAFTYQNLETFDVESGSVTYTPDTDYGPSCTFLSLTPNTAQMEPDDGHLFIDHSTSPATFYGEGNTAMLATLCFTCEGWEEPDCQESLYSLYWMVALDEDTWTVSADGNTISQSWIDLTGDGIAYTIEFQRGAPPAPLRAFASK